MRTVIGVGDRTLGNDVKNIFFTGDLKLIDNSFKTACFVGNMILENANGRRIRSVGNLEILNSDIKKFNSVGFINFSGACESEHIKMCGELKADVLKCDILTITKKSARMMANDENLKHCKIKVAGKIEGNKLINLSTLNISGNISFNEIINTSTILTNEDIECENFISTGLIEIPFLNSENSYIIPRSESKLQLLVGSNINILNELPKEYAKSIEYDKKNEIMTVNEIEGDNINVEQVMCKSISGVNVTVGDLCIVDKLYYSNKLFISKKAIVNEIIKL